jgi:hypothetical protein
MEVACGGEEGQIEIGYGHLCHDAGVGEDVTLGAARDRWAWMMQAGRRE